MHFDDKNVFYYESMFINYDSDKWWESGSPSDLAPHRKQAVIWTIEVYTPLGLSELICGHLTGQNNGYSVG